MICNAFCHFFKKEKIGAFQKMDQKEISHWQAKNSSISRIGQPMIRIDPEKNCAIFFHTQKMEKDYKPPPKPTHQVINKVFFLKNSQKKYLFHIIFKDILHTHKNEWHLNLFVWLAAPLTCQDKYLASNDHKNVKVVLKVLTAKSFSEIFSWLCSEILLKNEEEDGFLDLQTW